MGKGKCNNSPIPIDNLHVRLKAMLHGAIFLATCNAILLLRDVKLPNTSLHYTPLDVFSTYRKFFTDFTN